MNPFIHTIAQVVTLGRRLSAGQIGTRPVWQTRGSLFLGVVWLSLGMVSAAFAQIPPIPEVPNRPAAAPRPAVGNPAPARPPVGVPPTPVAPPVPGAPAKPTGRGNAEPPKMKMESLELITKDNITLRAFYFPSDRGKEAVPVIVVHEWEGQASPYAGLVKSLWDAGCAVIVPEFRGHGGSRDYMVGNRKKAFDIARMGRGDVASIIGADMEAVKKYLREENNAKKLNLNALALVGVREGAVIAAQWAVRDLNFPSVGALKQGQDVKAMVLVSPEKILKGFSLDETLQDGLFWQLPFLVVVGKTSPQFGDADRFYKRLETMKKRAGRGAADGLQWEVVNTSLAGPGLMNEAPGVTEKVTTFLKTQLVDRSAKIPWVERE